MRNQHILKPESGMLKINDQITIADWELTE